MERIINKALEKLRAKEAESARTESRTGRSLEEKAGKIAQRAVQNLNRARVKQLQEKLRCTDDDQERKYLERWIARLEEP